MTGGKTDPAHWPWLQSPHGHAAPAPVAHFCGTTANNRKQRAAEHRVAADPLARRKIGVFLRVTVGGVQTLVPLARAQAGR